VSFLQRQMEDDDSLATYDPLKDKRGKDKVNYLDPLGLQKKEYRAEGARDRERDSHRDRGPGDRHHDYRDRGPSRGHERDRERDRDRYNSGERRRDRSRSRSRERR
jgi:RNA-binding protein 39